MNTETRCPKCARLYRNLAEILQAGGMVRSHGLALKATCACGGCWPVGNAWRRTEVLEAPEDVQGHSGG